MGTWIEISGTAAYRTTGNVVPSWARGLKWIKPRIIRTRKGGRALMGTWIEIVSVELDTRETVVVPSWARGLKFMNDSKH